MSGQSVSQAGTGGRLAVSQLVNSVSKAGSKIRGGVTPVRHKKRNQAWREVSSLHTD
jgi:hypothetical protein